MFLAITFIVINFFDIDKGLYTKSIYGPYGIWSAFCTFIGGISTIMMILMFCRLLEQVGIGVVGRVMSAIGQNTMPIFLWQFLGFFVLDFLYLKISGESAAPDVYWMSILP